MKSAPAKRKRRFWRVARRAFRWFRIALWLGVLTLLILLIWLDRFGLPDFVKERLVAELRLHGVELRFTRMRLAWHRGIVADNIQFGRAGQTNGPRASATEAEVHLRVRSLARLQFDIRGVELRGGRVVLPVWGTNDSPQELEIEKVGGELKFLPGDQWELSRFQAEAFGVGLRLAGLVTNATAVRTWKFGGAKPKEKTPEAFWHDLVMQFERTKFGAPTEIVGKISGDAERLETFRANVSIRSPAIDSPWGHGSNVFLSAQITPQPGALIYAEVNLAAQDADTLWGRAGTVQLDAQLTPSLTQWTPTNAHLNLQVKRAQTPWGRASALTIKADFRPNPSDTASALADYSIRGQQVQTKWGRVAQGELTASGVVSASNAWPSSAKTVLKFSGGEIPAGRAASGSIEASLTLPSWNEMQMADTNLSWWARAEKINGDVLARLTAVRTPELEASNLFVSALWKPPLLTVRELSAALYDGELRGTAELNTATRGLFVEAKSDFDPKKISSLLSTNSRHWLEQFVWEKAPTATASARLTLPSWTNGPAWREVDWRKEVLPTLGLAGNFAVGKGGFRDIVVSSAQSDFNYTNRIWRLPNLLVTRPGEEARIAHVSNEETHAFTFVIDSALDPRALRPLFEPSVQKVFDDFTLTSPPIVRAEIAGRWRAPEQISARGTVTVTNAGYRGRLVKSARGLITFTNQVLGIHSPEVIRTEGAGRAESVVIDIPRMKLFINHAEGALEVAAVTHVISDDVEKTMAPYRFLQPPQARAHGMVDLKNGLGSDLRFNVAGGPFEWRSFRFQQVTGDVHWAGTKLMLSNVVGSMHGGGLEMSAAFDFAAKQGTDFAFRTLVHDINFHSLMSDLLSPTNKLEGTLAGLLVITNANTDNPQSWFGSGNATLRDGLLWDVPALGFFSPMLNLILPGAGNNKAREATATFTITNSVVRTEDLVIHASGMRLNYDGTVDFEGRINGRMEAQLFRDTPGVGQFVSTVFKPLTKLFEYRITGTLGKPRPQPMFIPKIIMMPFHPLRSMRELMEGDKDEPLPKSP
jgi:hypothetical protein